jgi:hypothetical protein
MTQKTTQLTRAVVVVKRETMESAARPRAADLTDIYSFENRYDLRDRDADAPRGSDEVVALGVGSVLLSVALAVTPSLGRSIWVGPISVS